ncbi:MAG: hypothetical protein ACRER1_00070 [Gammaproteobacteria bacterium]
METLTVFQRECELRLLEQLAKFHVKPNSRSIIGEYEKYVCIVAISGDFKAYIYTDQPEFFYHGSWYGFEVPDYPDDRKRIDLFVEAVKSCLSGEEPSDTGTARVFFGRGRPL